MSPDHMLLTLKSAEETAEYLPLETEKSRGRLQTKQQQPTTENPVKQCTLVAGDRVGVGIVDRGFVLAFLMLKYRLYGEQVFEGVGEPPLNLSLIGWGRAASLV